jgi:hypothetical protein
MQNPALLKSLFISFPLLLCVSFVFSAVEPFDEMASDFEAEVITEINPVENGVEYRYKIFYSENNKRNLINLIFDFPPGIPESEFIKYGGKADGNVKWSGGYIGGTSGFAILFRPFASPQKVEWVSQYHKLWSLDYAAKPGEKVEIELLLKGENIIPGVAKLRGKREWAQWVFDSFAGRYPPADFKSGNVSKTFTVPGPVPKPQNQTSMIDHLIATTTGAYNEGWISKADVYQGLMDKLVAAKENILKGRRNYHTARNIIGAFKHLLDAQRGKAIDEACYRMLYINADEMIKMLGR